MKNPSRIPRYMGAAFEIGSVPTSTFADRLGVGPTPPLPPLESEPPQPAATSSTAASDQRPGQARGRGLTDGHGVCSSGRQRLVFAAAEANDSTPCFPAET